MTYDELIRGLDELAVVIEQPYFYIVWEILDRVGDTDEWVVGERIYSRKIRATKELLLALERAQRERELGHRPAPRTVNTEGE